MRRIVFAWANDKVQIKTKITTKKICATYCFFQFLLLFIIATKESFYIFNELCLCPDCKKCRAPIFLYILNVNNCLIRQMNKCLKINEFELEFIFFWTVQKVLVFLQVEPKQRWKFIIVGLIIRWIIIYSVSNFSLINKLKN